MITHPSWVKLVGKLFKLIIVELPVHDVQQQGWRQAISFIGKHDRNKLIMRVVSHLLFFKEAEAVADAGKARESCFEQSWLSL